MGVNALELDGWGIRFSRWGDIGGKWGCIVDVGYNGEIELVIMFKCGRNH